MPKGLSWTKLEELSLCKAWAATSDNGIVGGENSNAYWELVHEKWSAMEGMNADVRTYCSLHQKLKEIKSETVVFHGCYLKAKESLPSGNDAFEIALKFFLSEKTKELSVSKRKKKPVKIKGFQFGHCWDFLNDTPKFKAVIASRRGDLKKRKSKVLSDTAANYSSTSSSRKVRKREALAAQQQREDMQAQTTALKDLADNVKYAAVALKKAAAALQLKASLSVVHLDNSYISEEEKAEIIRATLNQHRKILNEEYPKDKAGIDDISDVNGEERGQSGNTVSLL